LTVSALFDNLLKRVPHTKRWLNSRVANATAHGATAGFISVGAYARGQTDPGYASKSVAGVPWQCVRGKACCVGVLCGGDSTGIATATPVVVVTCSDVSCPVARDSGDDDTDNTATAAGETTAPPAAHVV